MAWHQTDNNPLPESMLTPRSLSSYAVIRPPWFTGNNHRPRHVLMSTWSCLIPVPCPHENLVWWKAKLQFARYVFQWVGLVFASLQTADRWQWPTKQTRNKICNSQQGTPRHTDASHKQDLGEIMEAILDRCAFHKVWLLAHKGEAYFKFIAFILIFIKVLQTEKCINCDVITKPETTSFSLLICVKMVTEAQSLFTFSKLQDHLQIDR